MILKLRAILVFKGWVNLSLMMKMPPMMMKMRMTGVSMRRTFPVKNDF
jgi:hypothetical protein